MSPPKQLDRLLQEICAATAALDPAVDSGDADLILALVERRGALIGELAGEKLSPDQCQVLLSAEAQAEAAAEKLQAEQLKVGALLVAHHVKRQGSKAYRRAS